MEILRNIGCLVTSLVVSAGVIGTCIKISDKLNNSSRISIREPQKNVFDKYQGAVIDYWIDGGIRGTVFIGDEDGDGSADVIRSGTFADWIVEGHKTKYHVTAATQTMTAEMRGAATEAMNADQKLSYLLAKRKYELYQAEKNNMGK